MKSDFTKIATLHNLLDHEVSKYSSAEIQLTHSMQQWINKASSIKLKNVLQKYHDDIQHHLSKIDEFADAERIISQSFTSRVMKSYIDDTNESLAMCTDAEVADACLLANIQKINHSFANALEMEDAAIFFHKAEVHEKQVDDRLTQLAKFEVNAKAKTPIVLP